MLNSSSELEKLEADITGIVLEHLKTNGSGATEVEVNENLVESGKLDSFDVVSILAELEAKYDKDAANASGSDEFEISIASLAKMFAN